ncbi:DUF397 domain-containing protein [Streptomyces sp. NBC_00249]|uniref:DUF397 domain-containing protein n=1 Tax=Streptomyces sp. NBC_00249 TaxID=2975690 RepID=UPI00224C9A0A|nr:DUF397 domain-containing protein [Streptomyces sp. NBC_00249]MCX5196409.1 DUF397 domain-containing protein [Streptomyces sp. NBC_00249]
MADSHWFKSSYSTNNEITNCVEVAANPGTVHVRDSKTTGPQLVVSDTAWAGFVSYAAQ